MDSNKDDICNNKGLEPENNSSSSEYEEDLVITDNKREKSLSAGLAYQFEVLTTDQIVQDMTNSINDVNSIINLPRTTILNLLNHFKWDKEKLIEKYFEGNEDKFFCEARIKNPFNKPKLTCVRKPDNRTTVECEICFTLYPQSIMTGLDCGHTYCMQCYIEYLTTKIMHEGLAQFIECATHGCDILFDYESVMKLALDAKVKIKYQHLITNNFVDCNRLLRWCPSAGCIYAIKVAYVADVRPVICKCNHAFCFACGENWHDPIQCQLLKTWIKKSKDDLGTLNWLVKNTKDCPNCKIQIEKNGGCNHMTCTRPSCRFQFCWICLQSSMHGNHHCNRYNGEEAGIDNQTQLRTNLARYNHYYNRYVNHIESLRFENKLYASVHHKMEQIMQKNNMLWVEVKFLKKAVDILCQCRQTLKYTYAFAYYLKKNNQSLIFEDNQNDLETATETISGYLERDFTKDDFVDFARKVQDKFKYCEERRNILLDHVHEGYEKGWWEYIAS